VLEVGESFLLANAEELGDFPQIERLPLQSRRDFLPYGQRFFFKEVALFFQKIPLSSTQAH
jgi:hypothetical protein